jgi:aspartate ammonia-lyase
MNTPANQSIDKQILETLKKHADYISWVNLGGTRIGISTHKTKQSIKQLITDELKKIELPPIDKLVEGQEYTNGYSYAESELDFYIDNRIKELKGEDEL